MEQTQKAGRDNLPSGFLCLEKMQNAYATLEFALFFV